MAFQSFQNMGRAPSPGRQQPGTFTPPQSTFGTSNPYGAVPRTPQPSAGYTGQGLPGNTSAQSGGNTGFGQNLNANPMAQMWGQTTSQAPTSGPAAASPSSNPYGQMSPGMMGSQTPAASPAPGTPGTPYTTDPTNGYYNQMFAGNNNPWGPMMNMEYAMLPWLAHQGSFAAGLEPQREASINNLINSYSPGNLEAQVGRVGQANNSQAIENAQQAAPMVAGMGGSTGAQQGEQLGQMNQAAASTNAFSNHLYSPEGQQAILSAILSAIGGGQQMTALGSMLPMQQAAEGGYTSQGQFNLQNAQQQNAWLNSLMGGLGGIFGSGGIQSIFKGLGGSGGSYGGTSAFSSPYI